MVDTQTHFSFFHETEDCIIGKAKVETGEGFVWQVAQYDAQFVQSVFIAAFSFVTNIIMLTYYVLHVQHPKFCLRWQRRYCLYLHMIAGSLEIFTGPVLSFFLTGSAVESVVKVNSIISLIHSISALYQVPIVFGVHVFMVPAYTAIICVKIACAVNTWYNPFCYYRVLALYNILSIYSWCRVLIIIFRKLKIFPGSTYSVGIGVATAICMPSLGPGALLGFLIFCLAYIWLLRIIYGKDNWKFQHLLGENSSNPFDNSTFASLYQEARGAGTAQFGSNDKDLSEEDEDSEKDTILRPLFHQIDVDGNGLITLAEMKQFALYVKQPKLYNTIVRTFNNTAGQSDNMYFGGEKKGAEPSLDYEQFRKLAIGTVHNHRVRGLEERVGAISLMPIKAERENEMARVVFDIIDRNVNGYLTIEELGVVLLEFGLPRGEVKKVFKLFDSNHDGKLEFDEFKLHFKPLWTYAFKVFLKKLEQEKDANRRRKDLASGGKNLLNAETSKFLTQARKESEKRKVRESRRQAKGKPQIAQIAEKED
mmetsp:Transcript_15125/g.17128  ORF Transcript_15125/g.17128 Transcript_15125/m.17128 type:complete len:536 (+) Transcript_15125:234-1841(+)